MHGQFLSAISSHICLLQEKIVCYCDHWNNRRWKCEKAFFSFTSLQRINNFRSYMYTAHVSICQNVVSFVFKKKKKEEKEEEEERKKKPSEDKTYCSSNLWVNITASETSNSKLVT